MGGGWNASESRERPVINLQHNNNIGFLRLLLASLVIIGHAPELIDGNRQHEPLTMLFHTLTLAGIAVNGFFLLSGYLITASLLNTGSLKLYFTKRVLRIYPGYLAVMLITFFILEPALGVSCENTSNLTIRLTTMLPPGNCALPFLHHPGLNGAIWTIPYEFRCYILIACLHRLGLLNSKLLLWSFAALLIAANICLSFPDLKTQFNALASSSLFFAFCGTLSDNIRFVSAFMLGVLWHQNKTTLTRWMTGKTALLCTLLMLPCLFYQPSAEAGLNIFGGLALYWLAFKSNLGILQKLNNKWDISYGTYLYGWPIASVLICLHHKISAPALVLLTLPLAYLCGTASWLIIEKQAITLTHGRARQPAATLAP